MNLLDRIARSLGYFTSAEVAACVRSAEEEATRKHSTSTTGPHDSASRPPTDSAPMPANYIRYFVSYNWSAGNGGGGFGCVEIGRAQTVRSQTDISMMVDLIADTLKGRGFEKPGVVILGWQPFEPPRQDDGGRETADDGMSSTVVLRLVA